MPLDSADQTFLAFCSWQDLTTVKFSCSLKIIAAPICL